MKDLNKSVDAIVQAINDETGDMTTAERGMVLTWLVELCKVTVELDVLDAVRAGRSR